MSVKETGAPIFYPFHHMKFAIKIKHPVRAEETAIDPGAIIKLDKATRPLIYLLRYYFLTQPKSIEGSQHALRHLFVFDGQPDWDWLNDYIKEHAAKNTQDKD